MLGAARADCERQTCPTDNKAAIAAPILQTAESRGNAWSRLIKARGIIPRDLSKVIKEVGGLKRDLGSAKQKCADL